MVSRAVLADQARAIDGQSDVQALQRDIVYQLVVTPLEKVE